jgi:hypothetical protein
MTDEREPPVADLAAEIMSAERPATPAKDMARYRTLGEYLAWAFIAITVVCVIGMTVALFFFDLRA